VKVLYRQAASDDVIRQFSYYLVDQNLPEVAFRFRDAVRNTIESLRAHPLIGARYGSMKPEFKTCDPGQWQVSRPSGSTILRMPMQFTSSEFCTASAMGSAFCRRVRDLTRQPIKLSNNPVIRRRLIAEESAVRLKRQAPGVSIACPTKPSRLRSASAP
jgi:plasmid stabilization system protein ParE